MALYSDGWVGAGARLATDGPNGKAGEPDPFGIAYVRQYSGAALTSFLVRNKTAPTLPDFPTPPPALAITACEVSSWDPRTVWVAFNQPVYQGSGRQVDGQGLISYVVAGSQVNGFATTRPFVGADNPLPHVLRLRLDQALQDVHNAVGTTTSVAADVLAVWFYAGTLVGVSGTPNPSVLTATAVRYPVWTLVAPKWHSALVTGSAPFAPLWAVLYSGWGRLTVPSRSNSLESLYELPAGSLTIGGTAVAAFWSAVVPPNLGQAFSGGSPRAARVVLEGAEDASPFTATIAVGSERVYGVTVARYASFTGAPLTSGMAAELVLGNASTGAPWATTNGAIPVRGVEDCLGGSGGSTVITTPPKPYGRVYGGNFFRTGGTDVAPTYPSFKPNVYALTQDAQGKPLDPEKPKEWTFLDLPFNYKHGDPIPQRKKPADPEQDATTAVLPRGVGYVRLLRGSAKVGSRAWDADVDYRPDTREIPPRLICVRWQATKANQVILYFDRPVKDPLIGKLTMVESVALSGDRTLQADQCSVRIVFPGSLLPGEASAITITCATGFVIGVGSVKGLAISVASATLGVTINAPPLGLNASLLLIQARDDFSLNGNKIVKLRAYYDMPVQRITALLPTLAGTAATVTAVTVSGNPGGQELGPNSEVYYYAEWSLKDGITDAEVAAGVQTASVPLNCVQAAPAAPEIPVGFADAVTKLISIIQPRLCYVPIVNRFTGRDYRNGDLVEITLDTLALADTKSQMRTLYDTKIVEGTIQGPHRHLIEGNGPFGGGPAYATPIPAGLRNFLATNWLPSI